MFVSLYDERGRATFHSGSPESGSIAAVGPSPPLHGEGVPNPSPLVGSGVRRKAAPPFFFFFHCFSSIAFEALSLTEGGALLDSPQNFFRLGFNEGGDCDIVAGIAKALSECISRRLLTFLYH